MLMVDVLEEGSILDDGTAGRGKGLPQGQMVVKSCPSGTCVPLPEVQWAREPGGAHSSMALVKAHHREKEESRVDSHDVPTVGIPGHGLPFDMVLCVGARSFRAHAYNNDLVDSSDETVSSLSRDTIGCDAADRTHGCIGCGIHEVDRSPRSCHNATNDQRTTTLTRSEGDC